MKVEQVEATTKAETRKKETLIEAERKRQEALIQEETSQILLSKAKIDAEAVKVAAEAEAFRKAKILSADNALAQKLELSVVAEGVETAEQLALIRSFGCDQYQGFLESPPVAPEELLALLRRC